MGGIDRMYGKRKRLESEREGERNGALYFIFVSIKFRFSDM